MKKVLLLFFFCIIGVMVNIINVNAYSCVYDFEYDFDIFGWKVESDQLEFNVDPSDKTISVKEGFFDLKAFFLDYYVDSKYTTEYNVDSLNGGCPLRIVVAPYATNRILGYVIFFEESNLYRLEKSKSLGTVYYKLPDKAMEELNIIGSIQERQVAFGEFNSEKSSGKYVEPDFGCDYFDKTTGRLKELQCRKKDVSCSLTDIQEYNNKRESLRMFCNNVTKQANFGISYCLNPCLTLNDTLLEYEDIIALSGCGISGNLIAFIANIIKWLKYIVPVIVIVLGILDFIKAIASEKDDEMKKAQGHFTKRLIAAALIFIIPFIIEFILGKMGFAANTCGIIDL